MPRTWTKTTSYFKPVCHCRAPEQRRWAILNPVSQCRAPEQRRRAIFNPVCQCRAPEQRRRAILKPGAGFWLEGIRIRGTGSRFLKNRRKICLWKINLNWLINIGIKLYEAPREASSGPEGTFSSLNINFLYFFIEVGFPGFMLILNPDPVPGQ